MEKTNGIGTLNEHSLHAYLKSHYESDPEKCEVCVGKYISDIKNDDGITEIQTRGFSHLRPKLEEFLPENKVTVVFPVAERKRLIWIDPENGETSKPRVSPKRGKPSDIFYELIYIKKLLLDKNLKIKIVMLDIDDYRLKNGWSIDGKKGSTRQNRMPLKINSEVLIEKPEDFKKLLPEGLPAIFTVKDFIGALHCTKKFSSRAIPVLTYVGAIEKVGKKGNAFLYSVKTSKPEETCDKSRH